jgi:isoleucyl-tRNA synthetase
MKKNNFTSFDPQKSVSAREVDILKFWKKEKIFERSVDERSEKNEYVFYDGPPFATGTPHYGHLLASTIKDVVPRYFTMKGFRVERRFGWDCHGLPIENIVEKELNSKSKKDIEEKIGVHKFNETCRSKVMMYVDEWEKVVTRLGRWVDFENDYKTMDVDFMESVMWLFAELYKKDLIYEGRRVSLYCPRCATPLSNFEIAMDNSYKTITEPSNTYKYKVKDQESTYLLAWSTTPWNKLATPALAVNPGLEYVKVKCVHNKTKEVENFILAESIFKKSKQAFFKNSGFENYYQGIKELTEHEEPPIFNMPKIVETMTGSELAKKVTFEIHYDFYLTENKGEKTGVVVADKFVTADDGTGIVTLAAYGEDDERVMVDHNIQIVEHVDESGKIKDTTGAPWAGRDIQEVNKDVNKDLRDRGLMFDENQHTHSVAQCWRCETRLFHKPQRAYFLNVQKIKDQMLEANEEINWVPEHLKKGRFGKGLESAPDWNLSRNRFWGSPIPIWKCDSCEHQQVVASIDELEKLSGEKVPDLHKHFIDKLTWKCEKCVGKMVRTPEVLDCWFESGAMPYAQKHFPFENEEHFKETFPGDFIAEYIAQTRGWFYTLHVLSTALFGTNSFKNAICTGTILAEDGAKMSKSKQNYPDPTLVFDKYGADAIRYYLMASSVMNGENFNFSERGVAEVLKSVILPIESAYKFFETYANIDDYKLTKFTFVRHGEGDHNVLGIYSGEVGNEHHLTELGKKQVAETAENIADFDVLISSPFIRTQETAGILKKVKNFKGEVLLDDRVREMEFGEMEGAKYLPEKERIKNETVEQYPEIYTRFQDFVQEISQKYSGKHIVVTTHGAGMKVIEAVMGNRKMKNEEFIKVSESKTGKSKVVFVQPNPKTELDHWILSELQLLILNYRTNFDAYNLETALREIPKFIDNLNNWFLRRSRERFWKKEVDEEKVSGYETLHFVLLNLSKILAPVCPFFTEELFQKITGEQFTSVHLESFPIENKKLINEKLSKKVSLEREIVGLAASIRATKKIKLRQPLAKLQFCTTEVKTNSTSSLLDFEIIKKEANVKEVEFLDLQDVEKVAKRIVRIDARKVGKKFGKKVQEMIRAGKEGDFKLLDNGEVEIAGEVLAQDEFEFGFLTNEKFDAESSKNVVVILETELSEDLKTEGISRELIREIQNMRKAQGFEISNRIQVSFSTNSEVLTTAFEKFGAKISAETLAKKIEKKDFSGEEIEIEGQKINLEVVVL